MLYNIFDVNSGTRKNKITQIKMSKNSIKIIVLYLSVFFFLVSLTQVKINIQRDKGL